MAAVAGSLSGSSDWRQIRVIRKNIEDPRRKSRVIICDAWEFMYKGDVRQDIPLFPGDTVFIPPKWTTGDQFTKDWNLMLGWLGAPFGLNSMREQYNNTFIK
jgi:hypothetical protein